MKIKDKKYHHFIYIVYKLYYIILLKLFIVFNFITYFFLIKVYFLWYTKN